MPRFQYLGEVQQPSVLGMLLEGAGDAIGAYAQGKSYEQEIDY